MRDGLSLLDQAVAFGGKSIKHEDLEALLGAVPQELLRGMILAILTQDSAAALRVLAQLLDFKAMICGPSARMWSNTSAIYS